MECSQPYYVMKKLVILVAVAIVAAVTQAASYNWKTKAGTSNQIYVNGTENAYNGTAYLFLSSSAATVYSDWIGGKALSAMTSLDSQSISSGKIATGTAFENAADPISVIFATEYGSGDNKFLYISTSATQDGSDIGAATISFAGNAATSKLAASTAAYSGAGWYTVGSSPVPEPTSGLLMLLGMAGLALRRRRA